MATITAWELKIRLRTAQDNLRLKRFEHKALFEMGFSNQLSKYGFISYDERLEEIYERQGILLKEIEELEWFISELIKIIKSI